MDQIHIQEQKLKSEFDINDHNFRFVNSGKLGISLILSYLNKEKKFLPKLDEIFVPKFMGNWIYSSLNQNILTSTSFNKNTKLIYIYHQFGIPQNMKLLKDFADENNLIVLEDCAHALDGYSKSDNSIIGNEQHYVIYSFSKFFNCKILGGIKNENKNFLDYVDQKTKSSSYIQSYLNLFLINLSNFLGEHNIISKKILNLNYSLYHFLSKPIKSKINFVKKNFKTEIASRKNKYLLFKEALKNFDKNNFFNYDELSPYKIPVPMINPKQKEKIITKFEKENFKYDDLMYDQNRNMIEPNYIKTLVLNTSSKNINFTNQVEIIRNELNE
tara:strand:- start:2991 stop:3977 length:987 start_codon:yes stop_codon:yes gene_type:complete